jgi:hypothetical protein
MRVKKGLIEKSGDVSQPSRKKMKKWIEDIDEQAQQALPEVSMDTNIQTQIERKLHANCIIQDIDLDLDNILSNIPYRNVLENMFPQNTCSGSHEVPALPLISKVYEESFMRQPRSDENPCVFGDQCECQFIDTNAPFTAVEFRLFNDPPEPQMCVLCSRKVTQKMFYDMCFSNNAPKCLIQRYGNIFGQPGEYATECMLACSSGAFLHCMPLPIMSHQRNKYSVMTMGGNKKLVQHRVSFEHFATPSATDQK